MQQTQDNTGNLIKLHRGQLGWTQYELAEAAEITQSMVSQYESGASKPHITTLIKIANALGIQPSQLLA